MNPKGFGEDIGRVNTGLWAKLCEVEEAGRQHGEEQRKWKHSGSSEHYYYFFVCSYVDMRREGDTDAH